MLNLILKVKKKKVKFSYNSFDCFKFSTDEK